MKRKTRLLYGGAGSLALIVVAAILLVVLQVQSGSASHIQSAPAHAVNQYSSKFLCGTIASPASTSSVLSPGTYNTAVNLHNPNNFAVTIQKKAVVAVPEGTPPPALNQGLPGNRVTEVLQPDAAMEVDCTEIANLAASATPSCVSAIPGTTGFCKGFLVVEAARIVTNAGGFNTGFPAQIDVVDILSVKEEDGYWKDYTFNLRCLLPSCPTFNDTVTGTVYGYLNQPQPPYNQAPGPYNLPVRPNVYTYPTLNCYAKAAQPCEIFDSAEVIRTSLATACACTQPLQQTIAVDLVSSNLATDSRDISLDYEFVSPKLVSYPCWPKSTVQIPNALCP